LVLSSCLRRAGWLHAFDIRQRIAHRRASVRSQALYDGSKISTTSAFSGGSPVGLIVNPSLPAITSQKLIKYLNQAAIRLTTLSGIGTNGFLFGEE